LYHTLESQIVSLFYSRGEDLLPRGWITKVKNSMKKLGHFFNTHRMVQEYFDKFYLPSYDKRIELQKNKWSEAVQLAKWKEKIRKNWSQVKVEKVNTGKNSMSRDKRSLFYRSIIETSRLLRIFLGMNSRWVVVRIVC